MIQKLIVLCIFLAAQFIITWYGYFMGKLSPEGQILGISYHSAITGILLIQLKFIWVPILINVLYGIGFQLGNDAFRNFLIVISLWIASGPLAAIIFNYIFIKEKLDIPIILGIVLITAGSILVVAHKEVAKFISL
jgi:drug/metabolite transporter (DMT)-like permease